MIRFDIGDKVICIQEFGKFKFGNLYDVSGSGDLTWNGATEKTGYGCNLYVYDYNVKTRKSTKTDYYFTLKEMNKYFIQDDYYKVYLRNEKINSVLNERQ